MNEQGREFNLPYQAPLIKERKFDLSYFGVMFDGGTRKT